MHARVRHYSPCISRLHIVRYSLTGAFAFHDYNACSRSHTYVHMYGYCAFSFHQHSAHRSIFLLARERERQSTDNNFCMYVHCVLSLWSLIARNINWFVNMNGIIVHVHVCIVVLILYNFIRIVDRTIESCSFFCFVPADR